MKIYITKYALTKGIQEYEVPVIDLNEYHVFISDAMRSQCFYKPDWHTDIEEALIQAELMRLKKISSLSKQIVKLRNLKFTHKTETP